MHRPNVLFLLSDQHRSCSLGCYGNPEVATPHTDALATESLVLDRAISNYPVCVPMRGSLLTALAPHRNGALANDLRIRDGLEGLGDVFAREGYRTGYIGKWHLDGVPRDRSVEPHRRLGFAHWRAANCNHNYWAGYYDDNAGVRTRIEGHEMPAQTNLAAEFIDSCGDDPWLAFVSWGPPHDPYDKVPEEYLKMYDPDGLTLRPNVVLPARAGGETTHDKAKIRKDLAGYYALVSFVDHEVGRLVDHLRNRGLMENTIVVYASDHGDMHGSHGLTNKQVPYAESVRVPFIAHWPGHIPARRSAEPFGLMDAPTTLAGLCGCAFEGAVDGRNEAEFFLAEREATAGSVVTGIHIPAHQAFRVGIPAWHGLVTRQYSYAVNDAGEDWVLFDDAADPYQLRNLIGQVNTSSIRAELLAGLARLGERIEPWPETVRRLGLVEAWNESQEHFGLERLDA